jgi:hypothetical protein
MAHANQTDPVVLEFKCDPRTALRASQGYSIVVSLLNSSGTGSSSTQRVLGRATHRLRRVPDGQTPPAVTVDEHVCEIHIYRSTLQY